MNLTFNGIKLGGKSAPDNFTTTLDADYSIDLNV